MPQKFDPWSGDWYDDSEEDPGIDTKIDTSTQIDTGYTVNIMGDNYTQKPDGSWEMEDENGKKSPVTQAQIEAIVKTANLQEQNIDPTLMSTLRDPSFKAKLAEPSFVDKLNKMLGTNKTGAEFLKMGALGLGGLLGAATAGSATTKPTGYQGGIPNLTASQPMLTAPPTGRRPGSGGINYGTGVQYKDEKGNIVSDTSTPVADLLAAAKANPFNEVQTNYGIAPTPKPLAPPTVRTPVVSAAQKQTIDNQAAAAAAKAAAEKAAAFAKTPEGMAQKIGLTLPAGWSGFNEQQKIDWFNKNNVSPSKLLQAGVSQADINWMQEHGYNGDTTTKAAAAGLSLPSGWNNYTAQQKIDYFNKNNVGIDALKRAGTTADDLSWMKDHGYTGNAAGLKLPAGFEGLEAKDKIDYFNKNNVGIDKLLQVGTSQADIDWMKNHGYTGNAAGVKLPAGFENLEAKDKIDWFNKNNVGADKLLQSGTSQADIDWMKQHGYTGNAAGIQLPPGFENLEAKDKIDYFNKKNVGIEALTKAGTSAEDLAWMRENGYTGNAAGIQLPVGFENLEAKDKIDWFNKNNIGANDLKLAGTSDEDLAWMRKNGYKESLPVSSFINDIFDGQSLVDSQESARPVGKTQFFNLLNQKLGSNPAGSTNRVIGNGSFGDTPEDWSVMEAAPTAPIVPAAAPAAPDYTVYGGPGSLGNDSPMGQTPTPAPLALPTDWGVEGGKYGNAQQKIDYFNQNNVSAAQLADQGVKPEEIEWMQQNGYKGMARGGITNLDHGGFVIPADVVSHFGNGSSEAGLKLLEQKLGATPIKGHGDGMSDSIPASIEGREKALVANEEAYVSPRMVERLGDGDMDEGSRKLKHMMEQIRKARTGTTQQGKQVNPNKFMPGGLVGYAQGGSVQHFVAGDTVASQASAGVTGTEQNLSNWVGPYATTMLGKAQALSNTPYQAYTGPLTAGASGLQNLAFNNAANLTPSMDLANDYAQQAGNLSYTPQTLNFDANQAQQYMNPYLQASLNPQLEEARRQSEITAQQNNAKMTQAGAFGGGRQAILTAENQRNLGTNLANITGQGYNTAYQNAMGQFNADQNRQMQENQFGANYGLQGLQTGISGANTANQIGINSLNTQAGLGAAQRGIESEGIAADKAQFEAARQDPYTKLQFQQSMLNGLPITAQSYTMAQPNALQGASGGALTVAQALKNLGY